MLPDDVQAYLERLPAVSSWSSRSKPTRPTLIPISPPPGRPHDVPRPLPGCPQVPPARSRGSRAPDFVHLVNGATSACVSPSDARFAKAARNTGCRAGALGFTDNYTGEVLISTAVPKRYLLTVMLHERGHQLIELSCLGAQCWRALLKATGNSTRLSIYVGPYFTRAHESAAESYAACNGGVPGPNSASSRARRSGRSWPRPTWTTPPA